MRIIGLSFAATLVGLATTLLACGGSSSGASQPASSPQASADPPATDPETFDQQAARGHGLYLANCARCHGANGQGSETAPRLVGLAEGALPLNPRPGAQLRKTQFRTAADVANFAMHNMPKDKPGSLPEPTYYAILAFALKANGVELQHPLDSANAKDVVLHKE